MTYLSLLQEELKYMQNKLSICENESRPFVSLMISQIKRDIWSDFIKTEENTKK